MKAIQVCIVLPHITFIRLTVRINFNTYLLYVAVAKWLANWVCKSKNGWPETHYDRF